MYKTNLIDLCDSEAVVSNDTYKRKKLPDFLDI